MDGVRNGYDLQQLRRVREVCKVPLIASGGAGTMEHSEAFRDADVDGAPAASVFHKQIINIGELKGSRLNKAWRFACADRTTEQPAGLGKTDGLMPAIAARRFRQC